MRVEIRLLGGLWLTCEGCTYGLADFPRRDAARLVGYLALAANRRAHREQVIDALWPSAPVTTVANRLHKAAHFVRKMTEVDRAVVLADDTVALFPDHSVSTDVAEFERLARAASSGGEEVAVQAALAAYTGQLLPQERYEDWAHGHRQRLDLLHRELLRTAGRFTDLIAIDATDEHAHVELMRASLEADDRSGVLRQFELLVAVLDRELGIGPSAEACALRDLAAGMTRGTDTVGAPRAASLATQQVRFCTTRDGTRLAYASSGSGPPLVKASTWLTHLDHDWDSPVWRHWWQTLSERHTLVRYDERGCGLSDWEVDDASYSLDAWVNDLETVVDALGLERFPLLGISQGGPIAITYAARHPERVTHVVVLNTCARATWARADAARRRELAALGELIKVSWGSDDAAFRQVYDARFLPDGPIEAWRAFDELQRRSTSPDNAHRLWRAFGALDCADAAAALDVPTLIMHSTDDKVWPISDGEELHELVAGSRFVRLPSRNHILQAHEPAFARFISETHAFLAS